jgi:protein TonB
MFDDFCPNVQIHRGDARWRFGASLAVAVLIFGGSSAAAISASVSIRARVQDEQLMQVEFRRAPPEPPALAAEPAPPAPVEAPVQALPKPIEKPRPRQVAPRHISDKALAESDRALPDAPATGPGDGVQDATGTGAGVGSGPAHPAPPPQPVAAAIATTAPKLAKLQLPVGLNVPRPKYTSSARRKGIEGTVVAAFDILEDGTVANVAFVSGPEELREAVLKALAGWRFRPAQRAGNAVRARVQQRFVFDLRDA